MQEAVDKTSAFLFARRQWDEAFSLVRAFPSPSLIARLVAEGTDDLLANGRTATLRKWLELGEELRAISPMLVFAEAQIAFRQGLYKEAESLAVQSAERFPDAPRDHVRRAYVVAGHSAHLEGRPSDAAHYFQHALDTDAHAASDRDALWGKFLSLVELQNEAAGSVLAVLESLGTSSADDLLRVATGRWHLSLRTGRAESADLLALSHLLPRVQDPLVRSSYLNACAGGLALAAEYDESLRWSERQIAEAEKYRLAFVMPHGHLRRASALTGLRDFAGARRSIDRAAELSLETNLGWLTLATVMANAVLDLVSGRPEEALRATEPPMDTSFPPSMRAEYLGCRALALSVCGRLEDASETARAAEKTSSALEVRLYSRLADVVVADVQDSRAASDLTSKAFRAALSSGGVDCFVTAYRARPQLLRRVDAKLHGDLSLVMHRANDDSLAQAAGLIARRQSRRGETLSPREAEVHALVAEGLSNKQIAQMLFLSESTVKVHIRHIFEKLNVRSRTEAAYKWRPNGETTQR
jgi:DNA-binding NarL/FixJ family response regulator